MLPDKAVKEFQEIYERKIGEKLPIEQARIRAENFIRLFDLITKPTPRRTDK
jgi:hypothetical protein